MGSLSLAVLINFNVALLLHDVRRVALNGPAIPADLAAKVRVSQGEQG